MILAIDPVRSTIENRFSRLKLKDESVQFLSPVSDFDIDIFKRHLRNLFPEMDIQDYKTPCQQNNRIHGMERKTF
jgi:hypothetical protein